MNTKPLISTERLYVRVWQVEDIEAFFKIMSDPQVHAYTMETPWTLEKTRDVVSYNIQQSLGHEPGYFNCPLFLKSSDQMIGRVGLNPFDIANRVPEIECILAPAYWGKGYASEIAGEILRYAFEEAGFEEVKGFALSGNRASGRVMEKIGMQGPQGKPYRGALWDFYEITRSAWISGK